ncbi:MAG: hypothetical protein MZW92_04135 [Comamonadaceae bacterium]|nr:hypothetical protein [Comamonadaceae bacterium]
MLATVFGVLFLAFFTLMPLHWVEIGAPWASIAVAFVAIPLIDALVGSPKPRRRPAAPDSVGAMDSRACSCRCRPRCWSAPFDSRRNCRWVSCSCSRSPSAR